MARREKSYSERLFQEKFVKRMEQYKWEAPEELNGNKRRVTVDDLINNWRQELNRLNADKLEGVPLTDNEFKQVMTRVNQISNSFEAAKLLSAEAGQGKIDGIIRDASDRPGNHEITLTIFKKEEVSGGDSSYKIAREVWGHTKDHRFDIVLLINGLPLINIEQKRSDQSTEDAFYQFQRYYEKNEFVNNFMAFSQMMIVMSEVNTQYFATPKSVDAFNPSFLFNWSYDGKTTYGKCNEKMTSWEDIVDNFLMIPMAHQMVGDFVIIDNAKLAEEQRHMLMRPYQVYALQAIRGVAIDKANGKYKGNGGYIWHTTGSGKTVTAFKTAQFLSTQSGYDKVIFLVDRKELDTRTIDRFKAFAMYEGVNVDETQHSDDIKKLLESKLSKIIVSTIFKLHNLIKVLEENQDNSLGDKHFVFIIDEAHRTTMGNMMGSIINYFKKNSLFFGFTGTPLFDESKVLGKIDDNKRINTTEHLFGPCLHEYTIDEAIADNNVLGFHVEYINTGEFKTYDSLREKVLADILLESEESSHEKIKQLVSNWDELKVETEAKDRKILVYQDEVHIPRVVSDIIQNWGKQSHGRLFNAILTVAEKKRAIAYYLEFKKQLQEKNIALNVAVTFSPVGENQKEFLEEQEFIDKTYEDYASFTGVSFNVNDTSYDESKYYDDLVERGTRGGSGRNPKNIDLIIVAERLLTGYDSKYLNTLYVDRELVKQKLIQAYSRTNRIYGEYKDFGSVINFKFPRISEDNVNEALKLYGSGGKSSSVIMPYYDEAVRQLHTAMIALRTVLKDPTRWGALSRDEKMKGVFKVAFKNASKQLRFVKQYYAYTWNSETFGMSEDVWSQYVGAYKNLFPFDRDEDDEVPIRPLEGKSTIVGVQDIDASYILSLIKKTVNGEIPDIIEEKIEEFSNLGHYEEAKLLREFIYTEYQKYSQLSSQGKMEAFYVWKEQKRDAEIHDYAVKYGVNFAVLKKVYDKYSLKDPEYIPNKEELENAINFKNAIETLADNPGYHKLKFNQNLSMWLREIKKRYN